MSDLIRAPFTAEQVAALNRFQQHGGMHPFTCGAFHTGSHVVLIARADGWHCSDPSCEYRQDWAHAFMAQPEMWPKPLTSEAAASEPTPAQLLDAAYRERAHLVALLATEYPAVIAPAPDVDEPGWTIAYLTIGGHQASWHIAPRDADLFEHVEQVAADDRRAQWDGHTTDAKYARIREHTAERAQRCGRECREGHTYRGRCELAMPSTETPHGELTADDAAVADDQAPADRGLRERYAVVLRQVMDYRIIAEWICCDPIKPGHKLCKKGHAAREMVASLLDDDGAYPSHVLDALMAVRDGEVQQLRAEHMGTLGEMVKARPRQRRYRQAWQSARHRAQRLRARVADLEQHHKTLCTLVGERSEMVRSARARVSVLESRAETALARLNLCGMALLHDGYFTEEDEIWPEIAPRITERLAKAREAEAAVARARAFAQELRDYCTPHGISALYADRLEARLDGRQDPA